MLRFEEPRETVFQSTHPRGVRPVSKGGSPVDFEFQSTHPRGVRPRRGGRADCDQSFNPRTREGCDKCRERQEHICELFQSTHPRGVRHL